MKILHIIYTEGISGAEKHLRHLLPGLRDHGIECELLLLCPPFCKQTLEEFLQEFAAAGIKTTLVLTKNLFSPGTLKKVNLFLQKNQFSAVHSHLARTDLMVCLVKQFFNRRLFIISTKHGYRENVLVNYSPQNFTVKRDLIFFLTRFVIKKTDRNISVSNAISNLFINLKLTKDFFPVIYHGVDVPESSEHTDQLFYKRSCPQLIIVGRLEEYKGHRYAFEAMCKVFQKDPDAGLVLLGEGSCKTSLQALAVETGIAERIHFLGFQKDPYSFIRASDVLIVPSVFEPFGLVFAEAMAMGTPVVAFDVPAGNEILNKETGMLVPRADSVALADAILYLLNNPAESVLMAEKARKVYLEKFTTGVMIRKTADFYRALNRP